MESLWGWDHLLKVGAKEIGGKSLRFGGGMDPLVWGQDEGGDTLASSLIHPISRSVSLMGPSNSVWCPVSPGVQDM